MSRIVNNLALMYWKEEWSKSVKFSKGFFFITQRKLFEIHRGGSAVRHAPNYENDLAILPGPAGRLLFKKGNNPEGDIGKFYFPTEATSIHIEPELLGAQDPYDLLCWSQGTNQIVTSDGETCMPCWSKRY